VEGGVKRDVRRFLFCHWRILECPNAVPVNLIRVWRDLQGFAPPVGAVAGWSFALPDGGRGVRIARPEPISLPDPIRRRLFTLLANKHGVEEVRLAKTGETPDLKIPDRLPRPEDLDRIEDWPADRSLPEPIVAELAMNPGVFVCETSTWANTSAWVNTSDVLEQALPFADVGEAERYIESLTPRLWVFLRYRAGCQAEADQREAGVVDGKATW
jgi:hypothetical protein